MIWLCSEQFSDDRSPSVTSQVILEAFVVSVLGFIAKADFASIPSEVEMEIHSVDVFPGISTVF